MRGMPAMVRLRRLMFVMPTSVADSEVRLSMTAIHTGKRVSGGAYFPNGTMVRCNNCGAEYHP
jgi:hypothetical protein